MKKLNEMSLDELWQLFPIFLVPHNEKWKVDYETEIDEILSILPNSIVRSNHHIGSTSIQNIYSKDIIDILCIINDSQAFQIIIDNLQTNGYILMNQNETRLTFNKGYTENGFSNKVFHLHIRLQDDHDELYFRDYLIEHPEVAKAYESLKLELAVKYKHHRDYYTESKTEFITKYTHLAKELYKNRY
ncbi:GrpB family protein [Acholeplasma equirhinis]|uniref:GrpB family protein n=1 Tax=Acholeplasma equirhinis TaxID=555393 RepID=UPI00197AEA12|nr:GrpB family protein [Acholeplasma equirhinis]MBN3490152.1 GrpB family protein [Acholeplasma equirhinis]